MSPLKEGERVNEDSERHNVNWWGKKLGFSNSTITAALYRGGGKTEQGEPKHPNQPKQRLIAVVDFPKLIKGFQETGLRPDGYHFHEWSLGVDTNAHEFTVKPSPVKTLVYSKEK